MHSLKQNKTKQEKKPHTQTYVVILEHILKNSAHYYVLEMYYFSKIFHFLDLGHLGDICWRNSSEQITICHRQRFGKSLGIKKV